MVRQPRMLFLAPTLGGLVAAFLTAFAVSSDLATRHDAAGPASIAFALIYVVPWALLVTAPLCIGGSLAASAIAFGPRLHYPRVAFAVLMFLLAGGAVAAAITMAVPFAWLWSGIAAMVAIALTAAITALFCSPKAGR